MRFILLKTFFSLLIILPIAAMASNVAQLSDAEVQSCLSAVDKSNAAFAQSDTAGAHHALVSVLPLCTGFPQLHHNLGVIESQHRNWDAAIEQFTASIKSDHRAAESFEALQSIYRYRASIAYQRSLNASVRTHLPLPRVQASTLQNADADWQPKSNTYLRSVTTVEYELYDWWKANQEGSLEAQMAHYKQGYPKPLNKAPFLNEWETVVRDIAFTREDAVVVLSYTQENATKHTQLLMRLQGNRWKIYRETHW